MDIKLYVVFHMAHLNFYCQVKAKLEVRKL